VKQLGLKQKHFFELTPFEWSWYSSIKNKIIKLNKVNKLI